MSIQKDQIFIDGEDSDMTERIDPVRGDVFPIPSRRVQPKNRKRDYRDGRRAFEYALEKRRRNDDEDDDGLDTFV